jgi:Fic family protein
VSSAVQYELPKYRISYDDNAVRENLVNAKASIKALKMMPFQRRWAAELQDIQLKMEISGTSQIEGADFLGDELETALAAETHEELVTRSQKQALSALKAYEWVAQVPEDRPISPQLIKTIHRLVVTGCDDDHCEPGGLRRDGQNVTFGSPRHRGVLGGRPCAEALERLANEVGTTFRGHDPLIQAIAAHYHFAAMHPFLDGNGRTARALEALMLRRAGLNDVLFVPMSNFYHESKETYLLKLAETRDRNHDLTPFLVFALNGVEAEVSRLTERLRHEVSKELFRNFVNELVVRLASTRKRVIIKRQLALLGHLLDKDQEIDFLTLASELRDHFSSRKRPLEALARDIVRLEALGAVRIAPASHGAKRRVMVSVNLDWPSSMTETDFFRQVSELPKSKKYSLLAT